MVVENGCDLLGLGTLKSFVSQELKMGENGWGFRDHKTLKSVVSHKWFDELSRLNEWFLFTDNNGMGFSLISSLVFIFGIYFVLIHCIWLTIKPNNFGKFYSHASVKHDQTSIFAEEFL